MIFRFTLSHEIEGSLILQKDPQGWKDLEAILKRGIEYHGTFYETMVQLEFACGSGKEFIDNIYDTYGVDAVINILIEISCTGSGGTDISEDYSDDYSDEYGSKIDLPGTILFEEFYEGVLDLSKYNKTSRSTFADILQSDFIQKVINRFETTVELTQNQSLDGVELAPISGFPSDIILHGKEVILINDYEANGGISDSVFVLQQDGINIEVPVINILNDIGGARDKLTTRYVYSFWQVGNPTGYDKTEPIFINLTGEEIEVDISWDIIGSLLLRHSLSFTGNYNLLLQVGGTQFSYVDYPINPFVLQSISGISFVANSQQTINVNATGSGTYTIPAGEKIFLCFYITDVAGNNTSPALFEFLDFTATDFKFEIRNNNIFKNTQAKIYKIHESGAAISQRITSLENSFRSNLLGRKNSEPTQYDENGCFSFAGILNGKHIRGIESPLFCSMKDFYQSINSYYPCGIGFQKESGDYVLRLEERDYFYDNSQVILQCQFAKEVKYSVAKEYYTGDLFIGFKDWEVENINGLNEPNSKRKYTTGLKAINNKVDLESEFIGGMYSIEFTRRKGLSTEDWKYDDKNFIICTSRNTDVNGIPNNMGVAEKNENFTTVNGILNPATAYNLRITPVRNLLRHLRYIASSIYKSVGSVVRFTYGEGNFNAESQINDNLCTLGNYGNELLSEKQDIAWDNTIEPSTPVYIPEYIEFEYPVSFANYLIIKNNPYKCIEVSEGNSNFIKGFIIEVRWKPVGGIAYFKLLRAWQ